MGSAVGADGPEADLTAPVPLERQEAAAVAAG
jgi:hypothetical protein